MTAFDPARARKSLFAALVEARNRFGRSRIALEDHERQPLTFGRLVLSAMVLGRKLADLTLREEPVGVLLPNVQALAVTVFGLNAHARVPALLNVTAGLKGLQAACDAANLKTILTSRRFVAQAKLDNIVAALAEGRRILWLEDVRDTLTSRDKLVGLARSLCAGLCHARCRVGPDDTAVILFTSGSEGRAKAVALSNANLAANANQVKAQAGDVLTCEDVFFNPLPLFHAFGLTAGLLTPVLNGMRAVLYPNPLHHHEIPKLIEGTGATIVLATDTFLQSYARAARPGDLKRVQYAIAGAEPVKDETRRLWNRHGTVILEGYGATECSPVLAVSLPDRIHPGSVGPFLPGVEWRLEPVEGIAGGGRLFVRGPNIMKGYLAGDGSGRIEPPPGGWYDTGDIVSVDDGLVTIRGRAKRFAKIAGEMISLAAVEALAHRLWPEAGHVAVALPDPHRGERIVLVTERENAGREALLAQARQEGIPELWLPKHILVGSLPRLGSGKIDYAAATEIAGDALGNKDAS